MAKNGLRSPYDLRSFGLLWLLHSRLHLAREVVLVCPGSNVVGGSDRACVFWGYPHVVHVPYGSVTLLVVIEAAGERTLRRVV